MFSASRTGLRLSRALAAPRVGAAAPRGSRLLTASRALSISDTTTKQKAAAPEAATKPLHITSFGGGHSHKQTIQVGGAGGGTGGGLDAGIDAVEPVSADVYAAMPQTLRSMTVYGKVVLVTGGARGLGNQMARACAEAGAKALVILDAQKELGDRAAEELHHKSGLPVSFMEVDVRSPAVIDAAVAGAVKLYGAPDVLVHAAGIADSNIKAEEYHPDMFRRLIDVNLNGTFYVAQAAAKAMLEAGKPGSMVLVGSMSGSIVNHPQEQCCYNASKAGVVHLAKSLAAEWARYGIRVNCISPGYMDTALNRVPALDAQKTIWRSLTPQGRLGGVDELNGLCVYLASDSSSFMTGADLLIDGGYSLW
ncbi:hypothetical protein CDD83_1204 [Cordyceps sp. RAO-2017]|nr:hypothetical protein CDD83_1204 [Cordyceps sp. RAO-2017]